MEIIEIRRPDDFHLHLRDGNTLATVAPFTARQFNRALIMPNLQPPVTTADQALAYRNRILDCTSGSGFSPLMALYLTDQTNETEIAKVSEHPHLLGFKLYPAGATTNSDSGVTNITKIYPTLEILEKLDVPLMIHGEVTTPEIDIFDREKVFIDQHLAPITKNFPNLRITLEHITTQDSVEFVLACSEKVASTITPQHLLLNRNAIFKGGLNPHNYCLPVLKREIHRKALVAAATSGNAKFFLGTDSAPHTKDRKESACGCAGCFTATNALELYASVFESEGKISALEAFSSNFGAQFYNLPLNEQKIRLTKSENQICQQITDECTGENIIPFAAGESISWRIES